MNMFKAVKATNIEEYLNLLPKDRKEIIIFLDKLIQKSLPNLKPHFANNMLGYGSFDYLNYKKEKIQWPIIALANQKNYISIYICAISNGQYLAEAYKDKLGKVSVGKSCIRFKKLTDINLDILREVAIKASKKPGLS